MNKAELREKIKPMIHPGLSADTEIEVIGEPCGIEPMLTTITNKKNLEIVVYGNVFNHFSEDGFPGYNFPAPYLVIMKIPFTVPDDVQAISVSILENTEPHNNSDSDKPDNL